MALYKFNALLELSFRNKFILDIKSGLSCVINSGSDDSFTQKLRQTYCNSCFYQIRKMLPLSGALTIVIFLSFQNSYLCVNLKKWYLTFLNKFMMAYLKSQSTFANICILRHRILILCFNYYFAIENNN